MAKQITFQLYNVKSIHAGAKVFDHVDDPHSQVEDMALNETTTGNGIWEAVGGVRYMHLTTHKGGYIKLADISYSAQPTPTPDPDPDPVPIPNRNLTKVTVHYDDGTSEELFQHA